MTTAPFFPLSAMALCLRSKEAKDESNELADSKAFSDVSENRTPSTAGSDDRRALGSDSSDVEDASARSASGNSSSLSSTKVSQEANSSDDEVICQGHTTPMLPPWRREKSQNSLEKQSNDSDIEATDAETDYTAAQSAPLSSRSDEHVFVEASEEPAPSEEAPGPEFASILRWDADRGSWIPEKMEIIEPPPLKPFAQAPSFMEEIIEKRKPMPHANRSYTPNEVFSLFSALSLGSDKEKVEAHRKAAEEKKKQLEANQRKVEADRKAALDRDSIRAQDEQTSWDKPWGVSVDDHWGSWEDCWEESWEEWPTEASATPLRALNTSAVPFTPGGSAARSFSSTAPAFIPSEEREYRGYGAPSKQPLSLAEGLASRTRLSSRAASFVPIW